jgi:ketosteroid isomerase-like protein
MTRHLALNPYDLPTVFAERFNARDLDGLIALYEPDAVLATESATPVRHAALRDALAANLALGVPIKLANQRVLKAGDVALLITDWMIQGLDPQGTRVSMSGRSTDVGRLGQDGGWRYAIDNPDGVLL